MNLLYGDNYNQHKKLLLSYCTQSDKINVFILLTITNK